MRAAVYVRKSTEQSGVADEHRSVTRQIANARTFAEARGWTVVDEHVYIDDGISGSEFAKRPGFIRLMNALTPCPSFDVLIMSEESRLGREAIETAYALKQIFSAGVRVFYYLAGRERTLQNPTDKLMMQVVAFADEQERERARQRTHDALARKALAGHVTGGRVFGYDNIEVRDTNGTRQHVERRINEDQARTVRRIFEFAAAGMGMRRIALTLNEDCAPAPRAQRGRPSAWCPSSVHEALRRDLYRGVITWNRSQKRDAWGRKHQRPRRTDEWLDLSAEHLRIVPEALWQSAHVALERRRGAYLTATGGQGHGRPVVGKPSKYLLTGFVECGECHGSLIVRTNSRGKQRRVPSLACWHYTTRGPRGCSNRSEAPLNVVVEKVFDTIAERLLAPGVVEMAIALAVDLLRDLDTHADTDRAAETIAALDIEAKRLVELVGAGVGDLPAVVDRMKAIKDQRAALARLVDRQSTTVDVDELEAAVRARANAWRRLLERRSPEAKRILEGLLAGRIVITPQADEAFAVRIPLKTTGLLEGVISPKALASPTGTTRTRFDVDLMLAAA